MRLLAILLLFSVSSFAGFFLTEDVVAQNEPRKISPVRIGGGVDVGFYLNSPDMGLDLAAEYRLADRHSLDVYLGTLFGGEMYEAGVSYRFFFIDGLKDDGHDDFIRVSFSGTYFEHDGDSYFPPRVSAGYGRDFMFLKDADFLCRIEVRASYLLTDPYSQTGDSGLFRETTHFIADLTFSVYFF